MVSIFKEKSAAVFLWLMLLSFLVHISFLLHPIQVVINEGNYFEHLLLRPLLHVNTLFLSFIYHIIIIIQALRLNYILQRNKMIATGFLPAMVFVLFSGVYPLWHNISAALIANFLILELFSCTMKLSNAKHIHRLIFDMGCLSCLAVVILPPIFPIVLIVFIGILSFSTVSLRSMVLYLLGLITPIYFLVTIVYLTNQLNGFDKYIPHIGFEMPAQIYLRQTILSFSILLLSVLMGISYFRFYNMIILARKGWWYLCVMFVLLSVGVLLLKNYSMESLNILVVPASAITANFFINNRYRLFSILLFWIIMLVCWTDIWMYYLR